MAFQLDPDVDGSVDGEVYEDRETLKPGTYHLGLSEAYVASWKPEDAFRELYQNWYAVNIPGRMSDKTDII